MGCNPYAKKSSSKHEEINFSLSLVVYFAYVLYFVGYAFVENAYISGLFI